MDLIRIYSEIVFSKVAKRYLSSLEDNLEFSELDSFPLSSKAFLDEARIHHPELSDDNLMLIYQLGSDEWSKFGFPDRSPDKSNIFRIIAFMARQMMEEKDGIPTVHFKDLFRWREVTQLIGEDILTCTLLAFNDCQSSGRLRSFDWPSVAHNDNPELNYLFHTKGLCELHSHLKASTNTFEISWVSLMNYIDGRQSQFDYLASIQEPSSKDLGKTLYGFIIDAARLRWHIYDILLRNDPDDFNLKYELLEPGKLDSATALERSSISEHWIPDYIANDIDSPMSVYTGERLFLYSVLRQIFATNDLDLTRTFYRYILAKSLFRKYLIQTNNNIGFSNFQRFQDLKTGFLAKGYRNLPETLPLWEARKHNFTEIFESRIVPVSSKRKFLRQANLLHKWFNINDSLEDYDERKVMSNKDWLLIFHFLKRKNKHKSSHIRDYDVRKKNKTESLNLADVSNLLDAENLDAAMDAASSEFNCRPEAYGQAFRFLRHYGFDATFHAGEDFYDLADGLRAIEEAITFLKLKSSDRIGHALALGIDAEKYYQKRHNTTALPIQWMLDNVVWLIMKSKQYGISMDSKTEWFLIDTYKHLADEIGYSVYSDTNGIIIPDISDYWDSMILRGDDPEMYHSTGETKDVFYPSPETWEYYSLLDSEYAKFVRKTNRRAVKLFLAYHDPKHIRIKGEKVKAFVLPLGYVRLIADVQNAMIKDIAKKQLCIECCPSSNVRIGRLDRFENHPIFRFSPIQPSESKYNLSVTVNTDDLGVFSTSLPNEYSLLALAAMKMTDHIGNHIYSSKEVYDWIGNLIDNGRKFTFITARSEYDKGFSNSYE